MENMKRVAVYVRVSTHLDSQENSLVNQKSYFTSIIEYESDYQLVDFYVDDGKSGKSIKHRESLQKLIYDCEEGKVDLILVKSISRFARNTVDLLSIVDKLSALGVEVFFDQEHLSTMDSGGRFLLTVLASLAEQESKSISENIKWSVQKLHARGYTSSHIRALGYGWDSQTKSCYIIEEEAMIVRRIFAWYRIGLSIQEIVVKLKQQKIKGIRDSDFTWQTINRILHNPLYIGKMNIGNMVVDGRHEAIILEDDFFITPSNTTPKLEHAPKIPKLYCGYCNSHMRRLGGHYRAKGREHVHVYRCICCDGKASIPEDELAYINQKLYGINYLEIINEKVRKYIVDKEFVYICLIGSNKPYIFDREPRFRGKKVFR